MSASAPSAPAPAPGPNRVRPEGQRTDTAMPGLFDRLLALLLPFLPRRLVRRFSDAYIAGETLDEAIPTVRSLHERGMTTTLDVLGEAITSRTEAEAVRDEYLRAIEALARLQRPGTVNVSVKLTGLGIGIDAGLVRDSVSRIARAAAEHDGFVRIDMEDSPYVDATLELYRQLREDEGLQNVGVVLQSYLHRTPRDAKALARKHARVRLVKGIYLEPETIAWRDMHRIGEQYLAAARTLAEQGCHVAFATHDEAIIQGCLELVEELEIDRDMYEFQVLLGVREERRDELVAAGHPVRVYVPFGAKWYEYSLRRLRENPRIAGHVARDVIRGIFRRFRAGRGRRA